MGWYGNFTILDVLAYGHKYGSDSVKDIRMRKRYKNASIKYILKKRNKD